MKSWNSLAWSSKIMAVITACFIVFVLNAVWLVWLKSHATELHASGSYGEYLAMRELLTKPFSVLSILGAIVFGVLFVARPQERPRDPQQEIFKIVSFAILVGAAFGLVLLLFVKL